MMKVCVITDNIIIYNKFKDLVERKNTKTSFDFYFTTWNKPFIERFRDSEEMRPILLREESDTFFSQYDLFISLHCKQLFPKRLVEEHTCINVHPGYNPYNRGWYPQVFGILNKKPIGVTFHLMDEHLDHGSIIYQKQLKLYDWETSKDIYLRILDTEIDILDEHFDDLLSGNFNAAPMEDEGNVNYKADFDKLCELDMDKPATYREVIDHLRALTFAPYDNAYFYDDERNKIYVGVSLKKEESDKK